MPHPSPDVPPRPTMRLAAVAGLIAPGSTSAADAPPRPRTRAHNAEFVMPDGWLRGNNEYGNLILVPPDAPQDQRVEIHIAPFDHTPRGVRGPPKPSLDTLRAQFNDVRVEQAMTPGKLPDGTDTMSVTASAEF